MNFDFDAIVVGAGPAGSAAALVMARAGLQVALIERGEYPGAKNVSGAALYGSKVLHRLIPNWWERAPVERYVTRRVICLMSGESAFSLDFKSANFGKAPYNAFTILRPKFDRWLACEAEAAGALLVPATVVDDVLWGNGRVVGVRTRRQGGDLRAPLVIAADGVNSFLAKKTGLQREFDQHEISLGVKEVIGLDREAVEQRFNLQGNEGTVMEFLGWATGEVHGGAFLYTNEDSLSLGIIVQISSMIEKEIPAYELLERFKQHSVVAPLVRDGVVKEYSGHMIPEAGWKMIPKLYTDGLLVAGDAAALCFATGLYLEGINYAIASGIAAGETGVAAHEAKDYSSTSLASYRQRLTRRHVLPTFKRFKHAPEFVNSRRLQNVYPALLCDGAERLFTVDGGPKRKIGPIALRELLSGKVSPLDLLRDAIDGSRALVF